MRRNDRRRNQNGHDTGRSPPIGRQCQLIGKEGKQIVGQHVQQAARQPTENKGGPQLVCTQIGLKELAGKIEVQKVERI